MSIRIVLFGQGPLCEAIEVALEQQGHELCGPFATSQPTELLVGLQAPVGVSAGYRHKLTPEDRSAFPNGILNVHTGYLPWNRGAYPNVWPFLDGSPAGVTVHWVDDGWDTGPIVRQRKVEIAPTDTAYTLYQRLVQVGAELIVRVIHKAESFGFDPGIPQLPGEGSFHWKADLVDVQKHDGCFDDPFVIGPFLTHLRACSFPPHGLQFRDPYSGKLIEATITLTEVKE